MSNINSIKSILGYNTNPGPIRSAIEGSKPLSSVVAETKNAIKQDFSSVIDTASARISSSKELNPEGIAKAEMASLRQNFPDGGVLREEFGAILQAYRQEAPIKTAFQEFVTPELEAAAREEFQTRLDTAREEFQTRVDDMRATVVDRYKAEFSDWKTTNNISEKV